MSKPLKVIGQVAGIVATVAMFIPGGQGIAAIAGVVSMAASVGSQLTASNKPPPARGSLAQVTLATDALQPYVMGEGLVGGMRRYDNAYGATLNKIPNPYRWMVDVYSGGGPVESITPYVDQAAIGGWFSGFLYTDTQLGAVPESTSLAPNFAGPPGWDSASKLSGQAAIGWNLKFDKDGKVFASGLPQMAAYGQWVKVYDPRLDSTFPGGSGTHRVNNEATWTYSANPALHAAVYAYGRHQNGKRVLGVGLPAEGIDWDTVVAWANTCDANGWTMFGAIYEPGDRWANLRDICIAGGGEPIFSRGVLSFRFSAPKTPLDTVTEADWSGGDQSVTPMASWRERVNTVIPKYRSPDHNWELVSASAVSVPDYVTQDGEVKQVEWPFNFVKVDDQAAQLAAYKMVDSRELQPIVLECGPRLRAYRPGECLTLDIPSLGLDTDAVIVDRSFDPATLTLTLTFIGETPAKHAYALGRTATPPPTPSLGQTAQERDELAAAALNPAGYDNNLILTSFVVDADPLDGLMQATTTSITVENHTRVYSDFGVAVTGSTLTTEDDGTTAITLSTLYHVYYDDPNRTGGAVALKATQDSTIAVNSPANPSRHYVGSLATPASGSSSGGGSSPPGWNPDNWF